MGRQTDHESHLRGLQRADERRTDEQRFSPPSHLPQLLYFAETDCACGKTARIIEFVDEWRCAECNQIRIKRRDENES